MNHDELSNNELNKSIGNIDPETVARWLESSGNYKVLRSIQMRDTFAGQINSPVKVLVVDTETTGLDFATCEVIEVGAVLIEVDQDTGAIGAVLGTYGGLEEPKVPITPENSAIHGITNDMVKGQRFDEAALKTLCDEAALFVAHNAAFDKPFMLRRFPWLEKSIWACTFRELPWTQENYSGRKLEYLLSDCGYFHGAHRAVEDCNALVHVLAQPLKTSQRMPFQVLFDSANESIYQIAALKAPFEKKDFLKSKGFRWNADDRVWEFEAVGFSEGKEVIEWLREQVYCTTGKIMLGFRIQAGVDRYSGTALKQQFKEV
ncbi:3'-5' exonuclease [Limnobacter profundi]|uniref:3'-5' exonuclease n=1 Tax=Limnobacter profundi TaxID=2732163 RepID=A0ABX6N527_9BURK|nr:3'-5' exonuclease [Limnobacter sp. SAORIC-580]QJR29313.1 3'-5' exonuclease [Limnobacter sp. SAORIC-580]